MSHNHNTASAAPAIADVEDTDEFARNGELAGPSKEMTTEEVKVLAEKMADKAREVCLGFFTGILLRSTKENRAYVLTDFLRQLSNERNFNVRQHIDGMPDERKARALGWLNDHIREAQTLAGRHVKYLPVPQTTGERRQTPVGDEAAVNG